MKPFPIYRLSEAITNAISKIVSIDIMQGIAKGLDPKIYYVDESGGPISTIAEINELPYVRSTNDYKRRVKISATYAQTLWMICGIALRNHDSIAIGNELENMTIKERTHFFEELTNNNQVHLRYLNELIDKKKALDVSAKILNTIEYINQSVLTDADMDCLYNYDMESEFGVKVNSLYVYAMTFCLLHEFSHHILDHDFQTEGTKQEELEADFNAFWSIYSDLVDEERNTAMAGLLCSLVSLIFVNKTLLDDGIHSLPIERIFCFYDLIKDDNPKYAGLLCHLFYAWAVYVHDGDMPSLDAPYEETLEKIREYMLCKERNANTN